MATRDKLTLHTMLGNYPNTAASLIARLGSSAFQAADRLPLLGIADTATIRYLCQRTCRATAVPKHDIVHGI